MDFIHRLNQIETLEDAEDQIRKAQNHMRRLRTESKRGDLLLSEKIELGRKAKAAEAVLRKLRLSIFDIEDHIEAGTLEHYIEQQSMKELGESCTVA